ncbi:tetratricopeptide repeat protein [Mariprofundus ferrinatatus]|uniref:tetratricopeptide repeat protein n=1 Tax=Mariprofundus ferrinatatus TaxID=1921087 RepID=UPI000C224A9B|nr:tetratricopeptide repeat protein [Mariprofundus ferrinatatus]
MGACTKEKPGITWEQEKESVISSVEANRTAQQRADVAIEANSARLDELDAIKVSKRLKDLEKVNRAQQAQIDALTARIAKIGRVRGVAVTSAADNNIAPTHRTTPVKAPVAPPAASATESVVDRGAQAEAEKNAYTAAYLALKSGRFEEASRGFNEQLDAFPDGEYADQAWYWLGEARLAQRADDNALHAFKYVVDHYQESVKHAAALLKLGQLAESAGQKITATGYYSRLLKEHPENALAEQAQAALNDLQRDQGDAVGKEQ